MTTEVTPNLGLSQMPQNTFQPSVPFNASLQILDVLTQLVIQDKDLTVPPTTTDDDAGRCWIVGASATGDWASHENDIAVCAAVNQWLFIMPKAGWKGYVLDEDSDYRYSGTTWAAV